MGVQNVFFAENAETGFIIGYNLQYFCKLEKRAFSKFEKKLHKAIHCLVYTKNVKNDNNDPSTRTFEKDLKILLHKKAIGMHVRTTAAMINVTFFMSLRL